jgi:hypothetical protein
MILPERVFGRPGAHWMTSGFAIAPISLAHPCDEFLAQLFRRSHAGLQRHIGIDALPLDVVRIADDSRFGDLRVRNQRDSTSAVPRRCPETLITSSTRPVIQ